MKSFYILVIKHIPCSLTKGHRIKVTCNGHSKVYTDGQIDEFVYQTSGKCQDESNAAEMFLLEMRKSFTVQGEDFFIVGKGFTKDGTIFIVDRKGN
jgi:hypothetical protein